MSLENGVEGVESIYLIRKRQQRPRDRQTVEQVKVPVKKKQG